MLKSEYEALPISGRNDDFVLYRIIGNDLYPRHSRRQSRNNVKFILENEESLVDCEKRWVINRIFDQDEEAEIISLLERHKQSFIRIPFRGDEYEIARWNPTGLPSIDFLFADKADEVGTGYDARMQAQLRYEKNIYVMNNNGARNTAIKDGRDRAKWVLPFDGNCFFTSEGYSAFRDSVRANPWYPYFIVPMVRLIDNSEVLKKIGRPIPDEEPQIAFRADAIEIFNEEVPYGRRPKVELLWRLGVPGVWEKYKIEAWDIERPPSSPDAGKFKYAGWVARLSSGRADLEIGVGARKKRDSLRSAAIIGTLDYLDARILSAKLDTERLGYYEAEAILSLRQKEPWLSVTLAERAEAVVKEGPFSVVDKKSRSPSGDPHDYFHPAPYWWPNPEPDKDPPYIRRDGERAPGTVLFGPQSDLYDRTSLQQMFDNVTVLAMAGTAFREPRYLSRAAELVNCWFVDEATRMNPHLTYAQTRPRSDKSEIGRGIIEFKDVYYFLDAVRLLITSGAISRNNANALRAWFDDYLYWLVHSSAGKHEKAARNNRGAYYDLQCAAISLFVGDASTLSAICNRAKFRLFSQLDADGRMKYEIDRAMPRHYCAFTLTGWTNLARLLEPLGADLWKASDSEGRGLAKAIQWLAQNQDSYPWPESELTNFPAERLDPLWRDARQHYPELIGVPEGSGAFPDPLMDPNHGVAPFWPIAKP